MDTGPERAETVGRRRTCTRPRSPFTLLNSCAPLTPTLLIEEGEGAASIPSPPEEERGRVRGRIERGGCDDTSSARDKPCRPRGSPLRRLRAGAGRAPGGGEEGRPGRLGPLPRLVQRREGRQALRGRVPGDQGRGPPDRLRADPPAPHAGAPGQHQDRRRGPLLSRWPLRALSEP